MLVVQRADGLHIAPLRECHEIGAGEVSHAEAPLGE
jgi:hypothetical protein